MRADRELSGSTTGALLHPPRPHLCWNNAWSALLDADAAAYYVEGWALTPLPVRHAWNETSDGRVIDVTPAAHAAEWRYLPTQRWTAPELLDAMGGVWAPERLPLTPLERWDLLALAEELENA